MKRPLLASEAVAEGFGWTNTPEYRRGKQQLAAWHRECERKRREGDGLARIAAKERRKREGDRIRSQRRRDRINAARAAGGAQ